MRNVDRTTFFRDVPNRAARYRGALCLVARSVPGLVLLVGLAAVSPVARGQGSPTPISRTIKRAPGTIDASQITKRQVSSENLSQMLTLTPTELAVTSKSASARTGSSVTLTVELRNVQSRAIAARADIGVVVEVRAPNKSVARRSLTIGAGRTNAAYTLLLDAPGTWTVTASEAHLKSGSVTILATPQLRLIGSSHSIADTASAPAIGSRTPKPELTRIERPGDPSRPILLAPPTAGRPQVLVMCMRTRCLANNRDAAEIKAIFMGGVERTTKEIRLTLGSSGGVITPAQLVIPAGSTEGAESSARLTSNQVGTLELRCINPSRTVDMQGDSTVRAYFGPPISAISVLPSPPEISLVDKSDVVVSLVDEQGTPVPTDTARRVSLMLSEGKGEFESVDLTIPAGSSQARTSFAPIKRGDVVLSASTPTLPVATARMTVLTPVMLIVVALVGGLVGGAIAYYTGKREESKAWRFVIGLVAGFLLYWAFMFGVAPVLGAAVVLNPLSAFALATLGGWLGTQVFTILLKRLGLVT